MKQRYTPEKIKEILRHRAEKAAKGLEQGKKRDLVAEVAVLSIGKQLFGVPMRGLSEISKRPPISHLPGMPPSVRGVAQIRGELIGVIDVARWFEIEDASGDLLAVVEGKPGKLGLMVDSVIGFRDVTSEDLVSSFCDDAKSTGRPIFGTTKDLIAVVDLAQLFRCKEVYADFRNARSAR